jgi:two-component system phosphate regulon sensor histidine kinase PhoR
LLVIAGGMLVGWLYGHADWGLMIAAVGALAWNLRQLLRFEAALHSKHFGSLKYGDSIWSRMYSKYSFLRQRIKYYRKNYRRLLKEVRKSTNAMPDGGIVLNDQFEIVLCNRAAKNLAGFRRKQDRGQRVDNILRDPAFGAYLNSGDFSHGMEIRSPVREGDWLHCRIVPYGANQLLLLIQDSTERRRLDSMRREFVANASHELRSPLTVISGYIDSLASDPEIPKMWQKPLDQMQSQAQRMNNIVAELLELSRLEGAGAAPRDAIVDVCGLLSAARTLHDARKTVPEVDVICDPGTRIRGSKAEVQSVIDNLLSNAIRSTDDDGQITLQWETDGPDGCLSVTDTGIGIEPEHLPRLTERFFRVDAGRSREDGGVGLGLAIVKHILERHDAWLDVESTPGKGSCFKCTFPVARIVESQDKGQ